MNIRIEGFDDVFRILSRIKELYKFLKDIKGFIAENGLYSNLDEAKSMGYNIERINDTIAKCLYYGEMIIDRLSLIDTEIDNKTSIKFLEDFSIDIEEEYLMQGAGFVLRYLGFYTKYSTYITSNPTYIISEEIYKLWENKFKVQPKIPIMYSNSYKSGIVIGYKEDGFGLKVPVYSKEGW